MNEVAKTSSAVPDFLKGGKKAKLGNIDSSDLIIPRVKLLQAISPEVEAFENAKAGQFWHTIAGEVMGAELRIIPIVIRKSLALWAPRGDDRGVLARSSDCVNWDPGYENLEFEVKVKGQPKAITYHTKGNVAESGLADFGSSIPGDDNSKPAASLTYHLMVAFPDFIDMSPAIIINTRSSVKPAKNLISKIELRPVDHYAQVYKMGLTKEIGDEGPYYNYQYTADGYVDEDQYAYAKGLYEKYGEADWKPNDEDADESDAGSGGGSGGGAKDSKKF